MAEIGTVWTDPSKQEIHIECPSGSPPSGRSDARTPPRHWHSTSRLQKPLVCLFGHWEWDYNDIPREIWEAAVPIVMRRMRRLYRNGFIRAGHDRPVECQGVNDLNEHAMIHAS